MQASAQTRPHPATDAPEPALIARAAAGDASAFETLMRRHNQLLFRTARSIMATDAEAEDVAQEAWLHAWRGLAGFRAEARLSTWLVRITRNEALGRRRRRSAQIIPLEVAMTSPDPDTQLALTDRPDQGPEAQLARAEMRRLLESHIDRLPEIFRSVFMLRVLEDMAVDEVAEALEIPEATVRTRLFRARSLLRESLAQTVDLSLGEAFSFDGARCDRMTAAVLDQARAEGLAH